jgi:hypothetical protein
MSSSHTKSFESPADFAARLEMATKALEDIYRVDGPFLLKREFRQKMFWPAVWWLTEAGGKYGTRYRSSAALQKSSITDLRHEHVFPIKHLFYLSRHGLSLKDTLRFACGCLVTEDEHDRLSRRDRMDDPPLGWLRYAEAEIEVIDMLEKRKLTREDFAQMSQIFSTAMRQGKFCGDGEVDSELDRQEKGLEQQEASKEAI